MPRVAVELDQPPAEIRVAGFTWTVHVGGDEWAQAVEKAGDAGLRGMCDPDTLRIHAAPGLHPDQLRHVIWHETMHAAVGPVDIIGRMTGDGEFAAEENAIRALAPNTLQVLRDNPDLLAYLTFGT